MKRRSLKFGTRGSPLARAQTIEAVKRAAECGEYEHDALQTYIIRTTGDVKSTAPISMIGGKGVFCRELEQALLDRRIDIAVHSMKDLPVKQPEGLIADCVLPREDVRDSFICHSATHPRDLPDGAVVGTSSLRRQAQLLKLNPGLKIVNFRGNLDTRLDKLAQGAVDATLLAMAGLRRLDILSDQMTPVPVTDMLPAPAQGCVCLQWRSDDRQVRELMEQMDDFESKCRATAERSLLSGLGGDCNTPLGALAEYSEGDILISGELLSPDGSVCYSDQLRGPVCDAAQLGLELARRILAEAADSLAST
ncbi:MAG: hydroxymethylbilane synthase [Rhodobacteraceae bacterium]|nr:hydroxymethylbilane synthase [Paracoccaceae bacterium]